MRYLLWSAGGAVLAYHVASTAVTYPGAHRHFNASHLAGIARSINQIHFQSGYSELHKYFILMKTDTKPE